MKADILPSNVIEHDLKRPAWETTRDWDMPYEARQFELWAVTGFGWCIPTLDIGRHRGASRLQPFLDLRAKGQGDAGLTRDRISLRRRRGRRR